MEFIVIKKVGTIINSSLKLTLHLPWRFSLKGRPFWRNSTCNTLRTFVRSFVHYRNGIKLQVVRRTYGKMPKA